MRINKINVLNKNMFKIYICLAVLSMVSIFNNSNRCYFSQNIVIAMELSAPSSEKQDVNKFFDKKIVWPNEDLTGLRKDELISFEDLQRIAEDFNNNIGWEKINEEFKSNSNKLEESIKETESNIVKLSGESAKVDALEKEKERLAWLKKQKKIMIDNRCKVLKLRATIRNVANLVTFDASYGEINSCLEKINNMMHDCLKKSPDDVDSGEMKAFYDEIGTAIGKVKCYMSFLEKEANDVKNYSREIFDRALISINAANKCLNSWYKTLLKVKIAFCGKFYNRLMNYNEHSNYAEGDHYIIRSEYMGDYESGASKYIQHEEFISSPLLEEFRRDVFDSYSKFEEFFYIPIMQKNKFEFGHKVSEIYNLFERYSNKLLPGFEFSKADLDEFLKQELKSNLSEVNFSDIYLSFEKINMVFGPVLKSLSGKIGDVEGTLEFCRRFYTALILVKERIIESYVEYYNGMLNILTKSPDYVTNEEKKKVLGIYKKTIVLSRIFRKCINHARSYLLNENHIRYFDKVFEEKFICAFKYFDGLLKEFEKISSALQHKFKYIEFKEFLINFKDRKSEESVVLRNIYDKVDEFLKCLKYENRDVFVDKKLNEKDLNDIFSVKLVEPTKTLFGLKLSNVTSHISIENILKDIESNANKWKYEDKDNSENNCFKIALISNLIKELLILDDEYAVSGDLISKYKKYYNNNIINIGTANRNILKDPLQEHLSIVDEEAVEEEKSKIKNIYNKTEKLIFVLREFSEDIKCEFFFPEYRKTFIDYSIGYYGEGACCYLDNWVKVLLKIKEAICSKFPEVFR